MSAKRRKGNQASFRVMKRCASSPKGSQVAPHRVALSGHPSTVEEGIIELVWSLNDSVRVLERGFSTESFSAIEFLRLLSLYRSLYSGLLTVFPRTEFGGEVSTALSELGRILTELGSNEILIQKGEQ